MVFFAASCAYLGHSNLGSFVVLALRYYVCENICFGTLFVYFSLVGIFFFVCLCVYLCQALFWLLSVLDMQKKKSSKLTRKVLTIFFFSFAYTTHTQMLHNNRMKTFNWCQMENCFFFATHAQIEVLNLFNGKIRIVIVYWFL